MQNILPAHRLTDAERATEAAQILARGILRWRRERCHGSAGSLFPDREQPPTDAHRRGQSLLCGVRD